MILKLCLFIFVMWSFGFSSNQLANETSPYLLQHKDNPVNWYAWGDEAFKQAKKQNKLIFLSIGYSTCHWCHVMAKESFQDKEVAKLLNDNYISIKVDKEQYPHIDKYFQKVFQIINQRSGGWPLSVFLTSDKKAFYSEAYIPKYEGYGSDGMITLINKIKKIPKIQLKTSALNIEKIINDNSNLNNKIQKIDDKLALKIVGALKNIYDYENFGFSKTTKFPQANTIKLLLKIYEITKNQDALDMSTKALDAMANGGIYDQIEGGFYRYTIDKKWRIPHFEKMLYTNAELIDVYTLAYKLTKNKLYKKIVNETIYEIDNRFKQNNVYMSASNADSKNEHGNNEEGTYFVFSFDDVLQYLEDNNIQESIAIKNLNYLGITSQGNFDTDLSIPYIANHTAPKELKSIKVLLKKYRKKKEYPFIDNKINTAWNAMYLNAKINASYLNVKYLNSSIKSLDELLNLMYVDGILYHQTIKGVKPKQKALLEDYSFLAQAVFNAYQKTLDKKYFTIFTKLVNNSIKIFYKNNIWYESQDKFKTKAFIDSSSYASALSVHIINIINYSSIKAKSKIYKIAKNTMDSFSYDINTYGSRYPNASLVSLMQKYEPVFIKSTKSNLKKIDIHTIKYPFIYMYEDKTELYLACKINTCFSFNKDFLKIKIDIEKLF